MCDRSRMREPGVGAAQLGRDVGVLPGEAAHVQLVEHRLVQRDARRAIVAPVEQRAHHHRLRLRRGAVLGVGRTVGVAERVGEQGLSPAEPAVERAGVRIDQELRRVAAHAPRRIPGAVHAVAVALAGLDPRQIAVPVRSAALDQLHAAFAAVGLEQTELDALGHVARDREAGAEPVESRTQRQRLARPCLHGESPPRGPLQHDVCRPATPHGDARSRPIPIFQAGFVSPAAACAWTAKGLRRAGHGVCTRRLHVRG